MWCTRCVQLLADGIDGWLHVQGWRYDETHLFIVVK